MKFQLDSDNDLRRFKNDTEYQYMKSRAVFVFAVVASLLINLFAFSCNDRESLSISMTAERNNIGNMKIVAALYPLEYFSRRIAGDTIDVINPIAPGIEAHDFEANPSDIRDLNEAKMVIYMGAAFQPWIARSLEASDKIGDQMILDTSQVLLNLPTDDPHIWLDPLLAIKQIEMIRDGMTVINPSHSEYYKQNTVNLIEQLKNLHENFQDALDDCEIREFVASHQAFGHLARRYGLEQLEISGMSSEVPPSPGEFAKLVDSLEKLGIQYVMVEPGLDSRYAETLAGEIEAKTLILHPLENLTAYEVSKDEDYFSIMDANKKNLKIALECKK